MFKEFKQFVLRGNVLDLAIAVILGSAFGAIVTSLVNDIIMPPIGLLLGGVDFSNIYMMLKAGSPAPPYPSLADAQAAGAVTMNFGLFINVTVTFLIVAFVIFLLLRGLSRLQKEPETVPTTKMCTHCMSIIHIDAHRCPFCTSDLAES